MLFIFIVSNSSIKRTQNYWKWLTCSIQFRMFLQVSIKTHLEENTDQYTESFISFWNNRVFVIENMNHICKYWIPLNPNIQRFHIESRYSMMRKFLPNISHVVVYEIHIMLYVRILMCYVRALFILGHVYSQ